MAVTDYFLGDSERSSIDYLTPPEPMGELDNSALSEPEHYCEEPGCIWPGTWYALGYEGDNPPVEQGNYYCAEHAGKAGFCWGCGNFWAGVEDFDFDPNGLCSNCRDNPDFTGEYEDDEDDYYPDDLPY